jgi:hypothetical protein
MTTLFSFVFSFVFVVAFPFALIAISLWLESLTDET